MYCTWFGSWIKESLLNEMQFHHLNESYDSYGTSFNEMQFYQIKRHVIFIKSVTLTTWLVRLVRVVKALSRPEQVVSIGHDWLLEVFRG